jgi:hypothetical protein
MENKKDKLAASLEKNLPAKKASAVVTKEYLDKKDIKDDYEFSRNTYKELISTGVSSLDVLAELARESEHPRAFEVLSKAIKDIGDVTDKLMALQKHKKELAKDDRNELDIGVTNNNVFIGSTSDLQRMLAAKDSKVINAKD